MLEREGYSIKKYQESVIALQNFLNKNFSAQSQLAFCAAVEHLTACTSLLVLEQGITEEGIDERMRKVWLWHSLEEVDHRSAMFDIYKYLGGGYFRRILLMAWVLIIFLWHSFRVRTALLYQSGHLLNFRVHLEGIRFLWGKNGFHSRILPHIWYYFSPTFHPSKIKYKKALEKQIHRYPIEQEIMSYFGN